EEVGGADHRLLVIGEAPEDRLGDDRFVCGARPRAEERGEPSAAPALALRRNRRRGRRTLAEPAMPDGRLGAQRAHVALVAADRRREANRLLPHQERPLADRARTVHRHTGHARHHRKRSRPRQARHAAGPPAGRYAGTASRSFFAFSISFWAMWAGTS